MSFFNAYVKFFHPVCGSTKGNLLPSCNRSEFPTDEDGLKTFLSEGWQACLILERTQGNKLHLITRDDVQTFSNSKNSDFFESIKEGEKLDSINFQTIS